MMHPSLPLVTIAIPTYNRADNYLQQSLTSALSQTYPNIEVIVSDNASTDHTETFVTGFGDSRIKYFRHDKNIGANNNFNFCLQQAKGTYFLLLHDDDLIDHDFIKSCIKASNSNGDAGIVRTGARVIDLSGKVIGEISNVVDGSSIDDFFLSWFRGNPLYLCSTLFHTDKLRIIGGFNSTYNLLQDVRAEVQLAAMFGRIDVRDVKASFRRHEFALTMKTRVEDWCNESLILLDLICGLALEKKTMVYREGMKFFANMCYRRAAVKSHLSRLVYYLVVLRKFRYKYPPPPPYRLIRRYRSICRHLPKMPVSWQL
jgi:glycosyltransferase involved in cell wall biosynthesis